MPTELLMIPEKDVKKLLPKMLNDCFEGFDEDWQDNLPKSFMKDELKRFSRAYKNNLTEGKYCLSFGDLQEFAKKSFESLVNTTLHSLVKSNEVEMGVGVDGEMIFWKK